MKDNTEVTRSGTEEWVSEEKLPMETVCKIEAMKMMARWLLGLKNDALSAQKTFRMLNAVIVNKGDLLEQANPSPAERAWLRLSAGCAMLKICEQKGRWKRVLPGAVLQPIHAPGGRGLDSSPSIKDMAKKYLSSDINRRRDYVKVNLLCGNWGENSSSSSSSVLPKVTPDFAIVYSIAVLSHWAKYESHEDVEILKEIQNALWFVMEPLIKSEGYTFGFFKALIEVVKHHKDALRPDVDSLNFKMWALCDLALGLLVSKTKSFEYKEFPTESHISEVFFKPHEDPSWINIQNYLPPPLQIKGNKKSGFNLLYDETPVALPSNQQSQITKKSKDVITIIVTNEDGNMGSLGDVMKQVRPRGQRHWETCPYSKTPRTVPFSQPRDTNGRGLSKMEPKKGKMPWMMNPPLPQPLASTNGSGRPKRATRK
ncbi:Sister chromatid cohesion protein PDS5 -like protein BAlike [Caligus rogercresseyi]|uniref:Sister chromatid cohesion protein PDS5 -like protein BAlike n=1 Tax=Caligus rogercresseyi TaxID=217165 RepID=A0A7T8K7A6_CALRO|nr:Sister chromatid cohesion protein PDS5 -like protein BAlike [Caligus rogercresseyi]